MGCANSGTVPKYAIEEYSLFAQGKNNPNLLVSRRKRLFCVPANVVAPSCALADIGEHAFQSMINSPKPRYRARTGKKQTKKLKHDDTEDVEEPPNHESVQQHIARLDSFMTYVSVNPDSLRNHVALRRTTLSPPETDSDGEASDFVTTSCGEDSDGETTVATTTNDILTTSEASDFGDVPGERGANHPNCHPGRGCD